MHRIAGLIRRTAYGWRRSVCRIRSVRKDLTVGDLCEMTGYSRDQLRGLLAELPRFASREATARVARVYSNHDALLVVVLCRLETHYGLKRSFVASCSDRIAQALSTPRAISANARLLVALDSETACEYLEQPVPVCEGLVVPLAPVFEVFDSYLARRSPVQRELGLPNVVKADKSHHVLPPGAKSKGQPRPGPRTMRHE